MCRLISRNACPPQEKRKKSMYVHRLKSIIFVFLLFVPNFQSCPYEKAVVLGLIISRLVICQLA